MAQESCLISYFGFLLLVCFLLLVFFFFFLNRTTIGEALNGDTAFADSLEAFGGGQDDPVSVSIGGCLLSS